jgi:carbon-monoxide dehydrogenase catalytic subunit
MRYWCGQGIGVVGNFLQQELAIATGAVDAMVVDIQCVMQGLVAVANKYHTKIITTSPKAKIEGATHIEFEEHRAPEVAKKILLEGIRNFKNRKSNVEIPSETMDQVVGFSHETINYLLGGVFRASYKPLNDNIINGRIRGIAGVVGCNNARVTHDDPNLTLIKELIKNDVIVLATGCSAMTCGKAGLLTPEATDIYAGQGLASVGRVVGIPPVLHMGACVDNSRILMAATAVVKDGALATISVTFLPEISPFIIAWWSNRAASDAGVWYCSSEVTGLVNPSMPCNLISSCRSFMKSHRYSIHPISVLRTGSQTQKGRVLGQGTLPGHHMPDEGRLCSRSSEIPDSGVHPDLPPSS